MKQYSEQDNRDYQLVTDTENRDRDEDHQKMVEELNRILQSGKLLKDEPMSAHTTFHVGGPAALFAELADREEIRDLIRCARRYDYPFFVTGNGSNLLVSDRGYDGLILHLGKSFEKISLTDDVVTAQAGASLARLARTAYEMSLTGLEFAAGIPGSVGGAVAMNAGAYGSEMKDVLLDADVLTPEGDFLTLTSDELDLSYRHSCVFERDYLVLSARFKLKEGKSEEIRNRMDELADARRSKQPLEYPSAGSTFKRPEGYFAGKLIQDAGLKGYTVGGAQVSIKHSGFVINCGGATASDILTLIGDVRRRVKETFGVVMTPEVRFVGFDEEELKNVVFF